MGKTPSTIFDFLSSDALHIYLLVAVFALLLVQLALYLGLYGRIGRFRLMSKKAIREEEPEVSVIVPLFMEDSNYLDTTLVKLLTQDYAKFEVVLVYVGHSEGFFNEIKALANLYPHLSPKQIIPSPRYPISNKIALNLGVKGAKYDFVVITSYDAEPSSERWLSLLAKGFIYGDIVLGYSGIKPTSGFTNFLFREYQINKSLAWISAAIRNRTYAGSRNALGFKKSLYFDFDYRGFGYLDKNVGEDDLFVQKIATRDNVSVVLSPRAMSVEKTWGGFKWWLQRIALLRTTHHFYPRGVFGVVTAELIMRTIFFLAAIAAMIMLPWKFMLGVLAMMLVRYLIVLFVFSRNANRLGERGLASRHIIYDIIEPAFRLFVAMTPSKQKNIWN